MRRFSNTDIYLAILAFIGFILAIWVLPGIHPSSAWDDLQSDVELEQLAASFLAENGYSVNEPDFVVKREVDTRKLHSLQDEMGRNDAISYLKNGGREEVPVFTWEVDVYQNIDGDSDRMYRIRFTPQGRAIYFENETEEIQLNLKNDLALEGLRETEGESFESLPIPGPDSLGANSEERRARNGRRASQVAEYHLNRSSSVRGFQLDSLVAPGKRGRGSTDVYHSQLFAKASHSMEVEAAVSARTGALENMDYDLNHVIASEDSIKISKSFLGIGPLGFSLSDMRVSIAQFHFGMAITLLLIFGFIFTITFIRKLGAGEIDTKIALRIAILVGVVSFFGSVLTLLNSSRLGELDAGFRLLLSIGGSAIQAVVYGILMFVVGGVTDSMSRHVWPAKLREMDLLWNGEFVNKPVGRSIIRGIIGAGVLLFISVVFVWLTDSPIYLGFGERGFYDSRSTLAFYAVLSNTFWASYLNISIIFLGVSAFFYRRKRTKARYYTVAIVFCVILSFAPFQITGPWLTIGLFSLCGFVLSWFFWEYGALATIVGYLFWFVTWMSSVQNIILDESFPLIIIISMGIVLASLVLGLLGLVKGKDEQDIKAYKPAYIDELAKKQRMFRELEIARSVQSSFLPQEMPKVEGLQIAAICEAATEVGGDYFDLIELENGKVAMVIGDVSGKGIQAAFYMTLVKGFVRSLCRTNSSPADLLRGVNALFHENSDRGTFISMIYGVLDTEKSKLTFARAGHNPLLLKRSPSQVAEVIQPAGLGLGLVEGHKFDSTIEEVELDIRHGDVLVFYTDGFSEAMDMRNDLYSDERLASLISESGHLSAEEILEKILDDVRSFVGEAEQHDDMTMIVVKLNQEGNE